MATVKKQKASFTMTLLVLIFLVPMIAAWLAYTKGMFLPGSKVNHGTLLTPPLSLFNLSLANESGQAPNALLKGKWSLVYVTTEPNDSLSQRNLYYMRQIRQATGKHRDRIERAIISLQPNEQLNAWLKAHYPGTYHFIISREKLQRLEASLPKKLALKRGSLYLVDPLGNIMLFYAPDAPPKGILKDLERVLKVSQIG